jgi:hypothetical protein
VNEDKGAGLQSCFSDVILNKTMYTANLSANKGPIWKAEAELDTVDCTIGRSWNYRCLTCKGKDSLHHILRKGQQDFTLAISDHHFPTPITAMDGK